MPLTLQSVQGPIDEPITIPELKAHLRLDTDALDTLLRIYLAAAREMVELFTRRQLLTAQYELSLDYFPWHPWRALPSYQYDIAWRERIDVPRPPLQAVDALRYLDGANLWQVVDPSLYVVDTASEPGRIQPIPSSTWPLTTRTLNAVVVEFTAGYSSASDVPGSLKAAILLMAADLFEHAEAQVEAKLEENQTVMRLLWPYRNLGGI